ncbi:YrzI family small protein [Halalkalibacter alkalisediminis]|uniref:YrzI family small protein n=1 Tax=Halalkalibacter alkalisediminis TaxID=935616 RepID=A0ABV6NM15_9BACI|nr:YrzI family small protein [Halalkalibacter alkalisediminis]
MTFHFILFTITIKKKTYTGEELQRIVEQQNYQAERQEKLDHLRYWNR